MIIVADSSPLISFAILDKLELLDKIFDDIKIPESVYDEITQNDKPYSKELKEFAINKTKKVKNKLAVQILQKDLDLGESEAIVLAKENKIKDILIDEYKGRKIAKETGLFPIGTIGVLLQAKRQNYINKVKSELDKLIVNHIRISNDLYETALKISGEK